MCNVCIGCCMTVVTETQVLCAACVDYRNMIAEEYQKYLQELKEAAESWSFEEADDGLFLNDDIPF